MNSYALGIPCIVFYWNLIWDLHLLSDTNEITGQVVGGRSLKPFSSTTKTYLKK